LTAHQNNAIVKIKLGTKHEKWSQLVSILPFILITSSHYLNLVITIMTFHSFENRQFPFTAVKRTAHVQFPTNFQKSSIFSSGDETVTE